MVTNMDTMIATIPDCKHELHCTGMCTDMMNTSAAVLSSMHATPTALGPIDDGGVSSSGALSFSANRSISALQSEGTFISLPVGIIVM